jgi:hypothetical protein
MFLKFGLIISLCKRASLDIESLFSFMSSVASSKNFGMKPNKSGKGKFRIT